MEPVSKVMATRRSRKAVMGSMGPILPLEKPAQKENKATHRNRIAAGMRMARQAKWARLWER